MPASIMERVASGELTIDLLIRNAGLQAEIQGDRPTPTLVDILALIPEDKLVVIVGSP